ncbi:MAG TPA: TraR/DksA C4-type zinc finger protein [Candidatus Nanoarchaeia archaeon]|nr:TraR/DksA C4-type zinc finger protein [Candidatus Nanoarchaeia archaeon]
MTNEQIQNFKNKLESEKKLLETELASVGRRNPDNPGDWEATPADPDETTKADTNDEGTRIEEYEDKTAILKQLETRFNEVEAALGKIASGTGYGVCEVGGEPIESDRLEANPAATTCKTHM